MTGAARRARARPRASRPVAGSRRPGEVNTLELATADDERIDRRGRRRDGRDGRGRRRSARLQALAIAAIRHGPRRAGDLDACTDALLELAPITEAAAPVVTGDEQTRSRGARRAARDRGARRRARARRRDAARHALGELLANPALERSEQRLCVEQQPAVLEHARGHAALHRLDERACPRVRPGRRRRRTRAASPRRRPGAKK